VDRRVMRVEDIFTQTTKKVNYTKNTQLLYTPFPFSKIACSGFSRESGGDAFHIASFPQNERQRLPRRNRGAHALLW
jgi:hypothetical protein